MGNSNIIAFCGRKESGKTELAKICEEFGYERISFARPLKKLISELISCDESKINSLKNVQTNYVFGAVDCTFISNETNIPVNIVKEKILDRSFKNVRQLLQYIGTDLIRKYNPNWHAEKMKLILEDGKKYVIDDIRFPNEAELIREKNGELWFIVRPKLDNISNHESENSLKWQDFDNIIVNNKTLEYLKFNWRLFMENGYDKSLSKRIEILDKLIGNKNNINLLSNNNDIFTIADSLFISKYEFTYDNKFLNSKPNKISCDNCVAIVYNSDSEAEVVDNPLMIEDLKKYM